MNARDDLRAARRVVLKVGSALLAHAASDGRKDSVGHNDGARAHDPFASYAAQTVELRARGLDVVLVSSGAIALGFPALGLAERPKDLAGLQAAAAAGQSKLMWRWGAAFHAHGVEVAQVLLTHADFRDRRRYLNARQAILRLLDARVVPVVNENDTVAVDEIKLGDNDTLAAQICGLCDAQAVVLLTSSAGLFTADPHKDPSATRVPLIDTIDDSVRALAGPAAQLGTGGMITKLEAAERAQRHGASTVIAPGRMPNVLARIFDGDDVGTLVRAPAGARDGARKRWIGTALRPRGTVFVDAGAAAALAHHGSLLYAGVKRIEGSFLPGDAVEIARVEDGVVFARGLTRLSAQGALKVMGLRTAEAQTALGEPLPDELVHRDDLVILG